MTAEDFLSSISQSPDDDAFRPLSSDWLEENSKPGRAELIRIQIELNKLHMDDLRYPELRRREAELLEDHQAAWASAELPEGVKVEGFFESYWPRSGFRRGLPVRVSSLLVVGRFAPDR